MSKTLLISILVLAILIQSSFGLFGPKHLSKYARRNRKTPKNPENYREGISNTNYTQAYYSQDIDHFNFGFGSPATLKFNQRYLYSDQYWGGADNLSPIFVYCGNEGDITGFWNNSGYMVDVLAPQYDAYLLFPEHRYFGDSLPFGLDSFNGSNVNYLTTDNALADYAVFIRHYKIEVLNCTDCPVITFGGSYGGMLSVWMRMKYPSIIDAAWGASAPILYFDGITPFEGFFEVASWDFGNSTAAPQCGKVMKEGFNRMDSYINQTNGEQYKQMDEIFDACTSLGGNANISLLEDYLSNAYTYMAMVDYPYPTSFLTPMPGYPVNFGCQAFIGLNTSSSDTEIFTAMAKAANIYYNYENATQCNDIFDTSDAGSGELSDDAWDVLACTEIVIPMGSNGVDDIFPARPWSYEQNSQACQQEWNVQSRYDWALNEFGGWNVTRDLSSYSNIFFSNGLMDPWHVGGVLVNISDSIVSYTAESAHHLDLRLPNELDPPSVVFMRQKEAEYIGKWIKEKQEMVRGKAEIKEISA